MSLAHAPAGRILLTFILGLVGQAAVALPPTTLAAPRSQKVIATGIDAAAGMVMTPDGNLWVAQRAAGKIVQVDPRTAEQRTILKIADVAASGANTQDGLLGMAIAPGRDGWNVFVAMTYASGPNELKLLVRRYHWNPQQRQLAAPLDILTRLPASKDHQSGRLLLGPDGHLFVSIGDLGANTEANFCTPNRAQRLPTADEVRNRDWTAYSGKILRLAVDGGIPSDNPVIDGVRSHVYAWGLRNTQGLTFAPDGALYAVDHGDRSDDELNRILPGRNYGWPNVAGFRDDQAYRFIEWSKAPGGCDRRKFSGDDIPPDVPSTKESDWNDPRFAPPLATFYTVGNSWQFSGPACTDENRYLCWPTVAPSSIKYLPGPTTNGITSGSLLITTLKRGVVFRVPMHPGPDTEHITPWLSSQNRYRDIVVDPDGSAVYLLTDFAGGTITSDGRPHQTLANPGAIIKVELAAP